MSTRTEKDHARRDRAIELALANCTTEAIAARLGMRRPAVSSLLTRSGLIYDKNSKTWGRPS